MASTAWKSLVLQPSVVAVPSSGIAPLFVEFTTSYDIIQRLVETGSASETITESGNESDVIYELPE